MPFIYGQVYVQSQFSVRHLIYIQSYKIITALSEIKYLSGLVKKIFEKKFSRLSPKVVNVREMGCLQFADVY